MIPLDAGPYLLEIVVVTETRVPVLGRAEVRTTSRSLATLTDDAVLRTRLCGVTVEDDLRMARTEIPDAFVAASPPERWPVDLREEGGTWTFRTDPGPGHVGWDPGAGAFPERAEDPSVRDHEQDGNPGATVLLRVPIFGRVEVYVAQHAHTVLEGEVVEGRVYGTVDIRHLAQVTLGASHPWFRRDTPITPLGGTFRLEPLEDGATCESLRAEGAPDRL